MIVAFPGHSTRFLAFLRAINLRINLNISLTVKLNLCRFFFKIKYTLRDNCHISNGVVFLYTSK